jgi:hypothetical protein
MTERYPTRCETDNQPTSPPPASIRYPGPDETNSTPTATSPNSDTRKRSTDTMPPPQAHAQIEGTLIGMCGH